MRHVSISELKAKLSEFLALVRGGEDVIVTDRGRPVARISAMEGEAGRDARLMQLVRLGRVRPPVEEARTDRIQAERPADPGGHALGSLLDDRRAGR